MSRTARLYARFIGKSTGNLYDETIVTVAAYLPSLRTRICDLPARRSACGRVRARTWRWTPTARARSLVGSLPAVVVHRDRS